MDASQGTGPRIKLLIGLIFLALAILVADLTGRAINKGAGSLSPPETTTSAALE